MVEIGILYVNKTLITPSELFPDLVRYPDEDKEYVYLFTSDWKPVTQVANFRTSGVQAITITTERGNREALFDRLWNRHNRYDNKLPWHGGDNYAIGLWGDSFFCDQWDDMDDHLHIRKLGADPREKGQQLNLPRPARWPSDARVVVFRGDWVPVPEWHKAIEILETEMF